MSALKITAAFALILFLMLHSASEAAMSLRGVGPATPCSPDVCKLPGCRCSGTDIPGNLPKEKVPQMVMLSFDGALDQQAYSSYLELFGDPDGKLKNPNSCNATATFFVRHMYTRYRMVQELYHNRHDIADNSISHRIPSTWWKSASYIHLLEEIGGQREILRKWGQVEAEDVVGYRAPFLQTAGNTLYKVLYDNKFLYDSSMPTQKYVDPPMWPYTLDYLSTQECVIPPCPTDSFPGLWEVPLIDYNDSRGMPCRRINDCTPPANEQEAYDLLRTNFERHYNSNRAPFPIFMDAIWFEKYPYTVAAMKRFLEDILSRGDVWILGIKHVIEWIKSPTSLDDIDNFTPWKCDSPPPPPACNYPHDCTFPDNPQQLTTCTSPCPGHYPWVGNPDGN